MDGTQDDQLLRLFPGPLEPVSLNGLYLEEPLKPRGGAGQPFLYTNFIASLDGRISLPDPRTDKHAVPAPIANRRDWRLFQELAACADALVTSGRYVRDLARGVTANSFPVSRKPEFTDLLDWRRRRGLAPQPAVVVVTASLNLPPLDRLVESGRGVYVATGPAADPRKVAALESGGVRVLGAGEGMRVRGEPLVAALAEEGLWNVEMIGGGEVLHTLIEDGVLDRLYLTQAYRALGGLSFDTLLKGHELEPPADFRLRALYYDATGGDDLEQLFAVLDRASRPRDSSP